MQTPRTQCQHLEHNADADADALHSTPVANTSSVEPNANTSTMGIRTQLGTLINSCMGFGSGNSEDGQ
jgi:hypothetical protein